MKRLIAMITLALAILLGGTVSPAAAAVPGWQTLHQWPTGSLFLACKYTETGGYGPVWQVRLVLAHQPGTVPQHLRAGFVVQRIGADGRYRPIATTQLATDQSGQWDVRTATGSQLGAKYRGVWHADRWSRGIGDETGGLGDINPQSFSAIRNC